jgi:lipoprotein-releasing system permease protein
LNYELFIARRNSFFKGTGTVISRPIIRIALIGVALGFAVMVIAISIVTGFKKEIRDKVIGFGSHIQISNFDENNSYETRPVEKNQSFIQKFRSDPDIRHVQVFATKAGIIKTKDEIEELLLKGSTKTSTGIISRHIWFRDLYYQLLKMNDQTMS